MSTERTWYTDANGRDMQKRVFNYRPTWKLNVTDPYVYQYRLADKETHMH